MLLNKTNKELLKPGKKKYKVSFFELIVEILGWLQIAAAPFIFGIIIGLIFYHYINGLLGIVSAILIVFSGLHVGIIWATRIWKKEGTIHFLSRLISTPELDKKNDEEPLK